MDSSGLIYYVVYGAVAMLALAAAGYLLLRRGNAFAPDITPPVRLRRWTAAFLAVGGLGHFYYLPVALFTSAKAVRWSLMVGGMLDFLTFFPLAIIVMLTMLQDRRRPLWPPVVAMLPTALGVVWCLASGRDALVPVIFAYIALLGITLVFYLLWALRQYGRWLRDNFADLERKEVWQTFAVMAGLLSLLSFYTFGDAGEAYEYIVQAGGAALVCFLVWRVETMQDLGAMLLQHLPAEGATAMEMEEPGDATTAVEDVDSPYRDFVPLLQHHCIDAQLYLLHDLTVADLARAVGTNRTYLSQYFASQGQTYNAYINGLRIRHFGSLYREAVAHRSGFTLQELARESGYHSYSTFAAAFRQHTGQTVRAWIRDGAK